LRPSRRQLFQLAAAGAATLALPASARAFGESALFDMPLLRYAEDGWNPRPNAIRRALLEIEMTTSIRVATTPGTVRPTLDDLLGTPFAVLAGDGPFAPLSDSARAALRTWLSAGGMLFVDSAEARVDGGFERSVRREIEAILPSSPLAPISNDHVLWRTFYIVRPPPGRVRVSDTLLGASHDGRLAVVYSPNDVLGAWARDNLGNWEYEVHPGGDTQRDQTMRFGVNLAMYALCLDYKADQVHVEYLLRQRRWRVGP
jgi:hypothetical protein